MSTPSFEITSTGEHRWFSREVLRVDSHWHEMVVTSHHGLTTHGRGRGSPEAYKAAYDMGYRWMQVDGLVLDNVLVAMHSVFGKPRTVIARLRPEIRKELLQRLDIAKLILDDAQFPEARWNIEVKSVRAAKPLITALATRAATGYDMSRLMVSSPARARVAQRVHAACSDVALAAPLLHGGLLGITFVPRWVSRLWNRFVCTSGDQPRNGVARQLINRFGNGVRPDYAVEQIWWPFLRLARRTGRKQRPASMQVFTLTRPKRIERVIRHRDVHPIVDTDRVRIRPAFCSERERQRAESAPPLERSTSIDRLALGGGGWRGACGGVGTIGYFADPNSPPSWSKISDVVGISGGAFPVAQLAGESARPSDGAFPVAQLAEGSARPSDGAEERPGTALWEFVDRFVRFGPRFVRSFTIGLVLFTALVVALVVGIHACIRSPIWKTVLTCILLGLAPMTARLLLTLRFSLLLKALYGEAKMRADAAGRRYAIGATGLNDSRLYAFTSQPAADTDRWTKNRDSAIPLGQERLRRAVHRAGSLPGVGQLGFGSLHLPGCGHVDGKHNPQCPKVPDRLVDGGISGTFGLGLLRPPGDQDEGQPTTVVVIDSGRHLPTSNTYRLSDKLKRLIERVVSLVLLSRWLQLAFDVGYGNDVSLVGTTRQRGGFRFQLIRLAEDQVLPAHPTTSQAMSQRFVDLRRLASMRDEVHRLSLWQLEPVKAYRAVATAVAACALTIEENADVQERLRSVGRSIRPQTFPQDSDLEAKLVEAWQSVDVLLLAQPAQLGPKQVRRSEAASQIGSTSDVPTSAVAVAE